MINLYYILKAIFYFKIYLKEKIVLEPFADYVPGEGSIYYTDPPQWRQRFLLA